MKAIIGKAARRKWAWILALVMTVSIIIPTSLLTVKAEKLGTLEITEVSGKAKQHMSSGQQLRMLQNSKLQ